MSMQKYIFFNICVQLKKKFLCVNVFKKNVFLRPQLMKGIELWCNGSTTDFGSACVGSNPASSTEGNSHFRGGSFYY